MSKAVTLPTYYKDIFEILAVGALRMKGESVTDEGLDREVQKMSREALVHTLTAGTNGPGIKENPVKKKLSSSSISPKDNKDYGRAVDYLKYCQKYDKLDTKNYAVRQMIRTMNHIAKKYSSLPSFEDEFGSVVNYGGMQSHKKMKKNPTIDTDDLDTATRQYLATMLWAETDGDEPLDSQYDLSDISQEALEKAVKDVKKFKEKAGDLIKDIDDEDIGHNFWLTRNHHGAGFWDGDFPLVGDELTEIAHKFGEISPYVGDDGKIYFT